MTDYSTPAGDGSKSILRDSKLGLAVTFVLGIALDTAISAVTNVDTTSWTGWWVPFVSLGLATAGGWLTAYRAKRRKV
jgi:high-affinity Fe2+/Pb2+ permease